MPGLAEGLRAMPSATAAATFDWPNAAKPTAKPSPSAANDQFQPPAVVAAPPACANTGAASRSVVRINTSFRILSPHMNSRQWVVDAILVQAPSRSRAKHSFELRVSRFE